MSQDAMRYILITKERKYKYLFEFAKQARNEKMGRSNDEYWPND